MAQKLSPAMERALLDMLKIGSPVALMPCKPSTTEALLKRELIRETGGGKLCLTAVGASMAEDLAEVILAGKLAELDAQKVAPATVSPVMDELDTYLASPVGVAMLAAAERFKASGTAEDHEHVVDAVNAVHDSIVLSDPDLVESIAQMKRGETVPVRLGTVGKLCRRKPSLHGQRAKWRKGR